MNASDITCGRCGAELDFEDRAPLRASARLGIVARGLRTFVIDDSSSLSTALATAERDVRHLVAEIHDPASVN